MVLVQRNDVEVALDRAMTAAAATRVTREYTQAQRIAWFRWRVRWHELESELAEERTLVICATCSKYRDGDGRWMPMPSGLRDVLGKTRSLCVSHGLCSECTARAFYEVKHLSIREPAAAAFTGAD